MLALYVAHLPWSWSHKLLHRSTDNAVPVHPCHVAETGRAANMESVCKCAWSSWQEAADLHMEYLNRIAKDAIKGMGTNKTEKAVMRVGRAYTPCTLPVHPLYITCILLAHSLYITVHYLYTPCTLPVYYLHTTCTLPVHYLHTPCTLPVHYLYTTCTLPVHYLYTTCILPVHYLYTTCTLPVHSLYTIFT